MSITLTKSQVTDIEYLSKTRQAYEHEVSFVGRGLQLNTRADAQEIVSAILNTKVVRVLRLEGNTISPEAAQALGEALVKHPELERFIGNDIFTGRLKDQIPLALKSMCGAIDQSGARLVEINMSDNAFGPIGLDALVSFFQSACCYSLKEIRMHNNGLGPEGARKFALALQACHANSKGALQLRVFVCGRNRLEYEGAKAISNTLKLIGTLEEVQMPQNGIRPSGIEFVAEALSFNKNLRVINLNDNTFRKVGGEWMAKALSVLENLECINFGDCLLRSRGAVLIARSLMHARKIKEIILSFNEINLTSGIEIAQLLVRKSDSLTILDLNGNKFGEEGKLEIQKFLEPVGKALFTMSEDEGSDDEADADNDDDDNNGDDDDDDDDDDEDGDEEEDDEEEVVDVEKAASAKKKTNLKAAFGVNDDEDDDYDRVDDEYDDYEDEDGEDDDDDDDDDNDDDEDGDEDGENDDGHYDESGQKFGNCDIVQPPTNSGLFKSFAKPACILTGEKTKAPAVNLFSSLVNVSNLSMQIPAYDEFVKNPTLENLKKWNETTLQSITQHPKFSGSFLLKLIAHMGKLYAVEAGQTNETNELITKNADYLSNVYLSDRVNAELFYDQILTEFGFIKSEDKSFHPITLSPSVCAIIGVVSKQKYFPTETNKKIVDYLELRNQNTTSATFNPIFKEKSDLLMKCFS